MIYLDSISGSSTPDWRNEFKRLEGAYAPATIKGYFTDLTDYENWCIARGHAPFPSDVEAVCEYLEQCSSRAKPATVRRRIYAISKAHRLLRLPDPTKDEDVNLCLRRVRRAKPARPKQAKGLTSDYLEQFIEVQPDTPWGLRNRAMLALGYDLLTRRSELIALRSEDITERSDGTHRVLIRRSKSDPFGMGRIAFTSRRSSKLVKEWLEWRGPDIEPLFCGIYRGKAINRPLSCDTVKIVVKSAAKDCGLNPDLIVGFSGHSMRVGAAQDLLRKGHDTAAIMRAGGWKSINVLARYLEYAEHNVWEEGSFQSARTHSY